VLLFTVIVCRFTAVFPQFLTVFSFIRALVLATKLNEIQLPAYSLYEATHSSGLGIGKHSAFKFRLSNTEQH